ncbi:hypothetical protein [Coleofasciculus sp. G2-EDA-02]|uniref:hypothetical protein n=1 Tax=Coleofasciculus sp. G2-EDA-02 TaxID=3069529 RepID=UPI0040637E87
MGSLNILVGAGLVTSGCNQKDSCETRPYTFNNTNVADLSWFRSRHEACQKR